VVDLVEVGSHYIPLININYLKFTIHKPLTTSHLPATGSEESPSDLPGPPKPAWILWSLAKEHGHCLFDDLPMTHGDLVWSIYL
jgi:hypothetical protein